MNIASRLSDSLIEYANSRANRPDGVSAIADAQAQSAAQAQEAASVARENAPSFARLASTGVSTSTSSFADIYKNQLLQDTDTHGDGVVSKAELERAVEAGDGTQAQADVMLKEMDQNHDGSVTGQRIQEQRPRSLCIG
ncbi:MAG: EF-hand domain-containing protein [Pararobbsia sp.]